MNRRAQIGSSLPSLNFYWQHNRREKQQWGVCKSLILVLQPFFGYGKKSQASGILYPFIEISMRRNKTLKKIAACILFVALLGSPYSFSQTSTEATVTAQIRKEAMENSQIMRTLHYFTDVYGPRLTGSPNHKQAAEWAVKQLKAWGLENAHLEAWDFGHPGWANERLTAHITAPVKDHLVCEVLAWTPGTNGTITSSAVQINLPEKPTQDELTAYFATVKDKIKGKIVMIGKPQVVPVTITPPAKRMDDRTIPMPDSSRSDPAAAANRKTRQN